MAGSLLIEGKIPGQRRPLFPDWQMPLPPEWERAEGRITLRNLITQVVQEEVSAFQARQEEKRLLHSLTEQDITRGLMKGKIDLGGRESVQEVKVEDAVTVALQAYEDGLYYVFVDNTQLTELEQEVTVGPDSRVTFIRLVALAGG
jgi:hypothetical protein